MVKTLRDVRDDRVRAYIIWVPQYGGDIKGEANKLSRSFRDDRVSYFLDMEDLTGKFWEQSLKLDVAAWDVYLLYGPSSRWEPELGAPDFWMHQLGAVTKAPRLDQSEFESTLKDMLRSLKSSGSSQIGARCWRLPASHPKGGVRIFDRTRRPVPASDPLS